MITKKTRPPYSAKRVYRWDDLPDTEALTAYVVRDPGKEPRVTTVGRKRRRVLEGLLSGPIFAASYARISDQVNNLRNENGINIETEMYANDPDTGRERYGVYVLRSNVSRLKAGEMS